MDMASLKRYRRLVPGIIVFLFWALLGRLTELWAMEIPSNVEDLQSFVIVVVIGAIYEIMPVREAFNGLYHAKVSENLRQGLVAISGVPDNNKVFTWEKLRPLFWTLVDNDASLTKKASLAYANGLIWTSCADFTAISVFFTLVSGTLYAVGVDQALVALIVFAGFIVLGKFSSHSVTQRHISIGNQQLEIIELNHKDEVKKRIDQINV